MTLEGQYKLYLEEHPESTLTFEEWNIWWSRKMFEAVQKYFEEPDDNQN